MQRLLVALTLILLVIVAYLGLSLADLSSRFEQESRARARESRADDRVPAVSDDPATRKLTLLEKRLNDASAENSTLKGSVARLEQRISELTRQVALASSRAPGEPLPDGGTEPLAGVAPEIKRDDQGNFVITQEEMDYIRAVQAKIDRERRIEGQTRNYMRRIDSLVTRDEIAAIPEEKKAKVEAVLLRFVTLNDDLVTAYVRDPTDAVKNLDETEKRDQLSNQREKYAQQARTALSEILPPADVAKLAERVFTNPWGLRPRGFNR